MQPFSWLSAVPNLTPPTPVGPLECCRSPSAPPSPSRTYSGSEVWRWECRWFPCIPKITIFYNIYSLSPCFKTCIISVGQAAEHGVDVSFDSQGMHELIKCISWLQCKSLWIKASTKCMNVNLHAALFLNCLTVMVTMSNFLGELFL